MSEDFVSCDCGPFRFVELMFQLNSRTYEFIRNADHQFYEGFRLADDKKPASLLIQGS